MYSKTFRILWKYYKDEPVLNNAGAIIDFLADKSNTILFKFNKKIIGQTGNHGTKDVEIVVPLKYLSNFWKTLEMSLITC